MLRPEASHESSPQHGLGHRVKYAAAILCSTLAAGLTHAPSVHAETPQTTITLEGSAWPKNESFGLAGPPLTEPGNTLAQLPHSEEFSGPDSAFPNNAISVAQDDAHPNEAKVEKAIAYEREHHKPDSMKPNEPAVVVPTGVSNADVLADPAAKGKDICYPYFPGTSVLNPDYRRNSCENIALAIERRYLTAEMKRHPHVLYTAQIEPETNNGPSYFKLEDGPAFAVRQYITAAQVAHALGRGTIVEPGELWNFPSKYATEYYHLLPIELKKHHLQMPPIEAVHFYKFTNCNKASLFQGFLRLLDNNGLLIPAEKGYGLDVPESGEETGLTFQDCDNAKAMANADHKNTATLTAANLEKMAMAEDLGAEAIVDIGYWAPPNLKIRQLIYGIGGMSPPCQGGGTWDSTWFLPDGPFGALRTPTIPFYILTKQHVPNWIMHPRGLAQIQQDELLMIPPINWPGSEDGDCKYGQQLETPQAAAAANRPPSENKLNVVTAKPQEASQHPDPHDVGNRHVIARTNVNVGNHELRVRITNKRFKEEVKLNRRPSDFKKMFVIEDNSVVERSVLGPVRK